MTSNKYLQPLKRCFFALIKVPKNLSIHILTRVQSTDSKLEMLIKYCRVRTRNSIVIERWMESEPWINEFDLSDSTESIDF